MVGLERYIRHLPAELTRFSVSAARLELARRNLTTELIYFVFSWSDYYEIASMCPKMQLFSLVSRSFKLCYTEIILNKNRIQEEL